MHGQNTPGISYEPHVLAPLQRASRPTGGLGEPLTAAGSIVRVLVRLLDAFSRSIPALERAVLVIYILRVPVGVSFGRAGGPAARRPPRAEEAVEGGRGGGVGSSWVVGGMVKAKVGVGGRREGCGPGLHGQNTPGISYGSHSLAPRSGHSGQPDASNCRQPARDS